ncbi:growth hormone secretagogue receptor type 1 isoform X1 [Leptopilina boulardi]|uniref:growth hormone secretagogue receptor type 1 isoform X1 n=1 Tax=Leptopilina boulardi TaxID=63433 RepID=UPI0021F6982A|nr:growth hormone secretagogue receptor type 1 isoform X1 [Leptopilina boulardi]XP_051163573.1 growth hormone secretagogue receptor type 1 isoform X1 [Leptopilina boulardi]XP_051163574.1 growth hormone secretagogue receptor type 1 isoform X1 [Leptopilina boulardi]XP_051163575.1 growth hormone secretagogue receptor type 1 isoform X1 [Leptopilina boulardi]XP_051163576.1 growth hormone secretagogue receptor type 1 isoform X1 [Leptopilina boulardi]XP_051163578.1 growth hormone secretagogue recepto
MFSTMASMAFEQNSSFYTTAMGSSTLDGFSVSIPEPENGTFLPYMLPTYIRTTSMVVCIMVMALGIIGNLMVPLVVLRGKDMRNSTNFFLVNLSVADLCVLLFCTPTVLVEVNSGPNVWPLGESMCKAVPFMELTVAHASVLTILAISFERYYAICEPLRAGYVCTKTRATCLCLLAWATAAACTSPILWITQYRLEKDHNGSFFETCSTPADSTVNQIFFLIIIIVFFIIPFLILLVLYTVIARHLMENPAISRGPANNLLKYRRQVILMLGTVVLCFFICLLPFRALTFWIIVTPPEIIVTLDFDDYYCLIYFCRVMLYLNSAINPILYNLMSTKFREGFLRLCGISKTKVKRKKESSGRTGTTGSTTGSSTNQSDYWRRHSSNKSCSVKVPDVASDKQIKLPLLSAVTGSIIGKKQESYV